MREGVRLSLLVGPSIPVPAPRVVMEALTDLTVTTKDTGRSGFEMKFTLSKRSPLHTLFLIASVNPLPDLRVIIAVTLNGIQEVLIDGVVTNQDVGGGDGGQAQLTVRGEDLSVLMDKQETSGLPFPGAANEARVKQILAKYAVYGVLPDVTSSPHIDEASPTNGRTLKARRLVGVRGAGLAFDGLHYVSSVTHSIKRGAYKQSFTLSRGGLLSSVPGLPA